VGQSHRVHVSDGLGWSDPLAAIFPNPVDAAAPRQTRWPSFGHTESQAPATAAGSAGPALAPPGGGSRSGAGLGTPLTPHTIPGLDALTALVLSQPGATPSLSTLAQPASPVTRVADPSPASGTNVSAGQDTSRAAYAHLPLEFEAKRGQTDPQVHFQAQGPGCSLFLTSTEAVMVFPRTTTPSSAADGGIAVPAEPLTRLGTPQPAAVALDKADVLRMQLIGANPSPEVVGQDRLRGQSNYFLGNDPAKWVTGVPHYGRVAHHGVYPGVDLLFYGNPQQQLEYDFTVRPGADPAGVIALNFDGAQSLTLDAQSDLVIHMAGGDLVEHAPVLYQQQGTQRQAVDGHYVLEGPHRAGFVVGAYDGSRPLVIDPTLVYSTYLGGSGNDYGNGIAVDGAGNAYVTGYTLSSDFPVTNGSTLHGSANAFVTKLNPNLSGSASLIYSTFLGGNGGDYGVGIAVDGAGNVYVTGDTGSSDFPTTSTAFQTTNHGSGDGFVTKLTASGTALLYSTYLGGSGYDLGTGIAVDGAGNAFVTGDTGSRDFPTTRGPFQTSLYGLSNAFVAKLNPNLSGSASLVYSTFLGGSGSDGGVGIAVDSSGNAYVTGETRSTSFPVKPDAFQPTLRGSQNAFVTKLNPNLSGSASLIYSTFLGGSGNDYGNAIAVDSSGNAFVTGSTNSVDFPTAANAFQRTYGGGGDAFVAKVSPLPPVATHLGLRASSNPVTAGAAFNLTVTALDANNNRVPTYLGTIHFSSPTLLRDYTFTAADQGTHTFAVTLDTAGNQTITAQDVANANLNGSVAVTVVPGAPNFLDVQGLPSPVAAGVAAPFTVTVRDVYGNAATNYRGTVRFQSTDLQAALPAAYTFTPTDQGAHTFAATFRTLGTQALWVTDTAQPGLAGGRPNILVVSPGQAAKFSIVATAAATAGSPFDITVTAQDTSGNTVSGYTGMVHFTMDDPTGGRVPMDYTFQPGDHGTKRFVSGVILDTVGTWKVTATDVNSGITGSVSVNVTTAAAASRFQVYAPASVASGTLFPILVVAKDAFGNTATAYAGTVHFTSTDPPANLPADATFTPLMYGTGTFSVTLFTRGTQSVTATDRNNPAITGSASVNVN
jgi:hypothetical protein